MSALTAPPTPDVSDEPRSLAADAGAAAAYLEAVARHRTLAGEDLARALSTVATGVRRDVITTIQGAGLGHVGVRSRQGLAQRGEVVASGGSEPHPQISASNVFDANLDDLTVVEPGDLLVLPVVDVNGLHPAGREAEIDEDDGLQAALCVEGDHCSRPLLHPLMIAP